MDNTPRYAPSVISLLHCHLAYVSNVKVYATWDHRPEDCPIKGNLMALELITVFGSHWFGFEKCWINSELRMVCQGFDERNEVVSKWEVCNLPKRENKC